MLENIPFQEELFTRENGKYLYTSIDDIPEQLLPYINTENFTINSDGSYAFNPITYDMDNLLSLSLAINKVQHEKIKQLEADIALIKSTYRIIIMKRGFWSGIKTYLRPFAN